MTDQEMRVWRDRAVADGNDPEDVLRLLYEHTDDLRQCVGCGASIAFQEARPPEAMLAHRHRLCDPLCRSCEDGPLGHDAYHLDVNQHRYDAAAADDRPNAKYLARKVAERAHLACRWAARGVECTWVKMIREPFRGDG
jgi:hypothetical protein